MLLRKFKQRTQNNIFWCISYPSNCRAPIYRVPRYTVPVCVTPISCFRIEHVLKFPWFSFTVPPIFRVLLPLRSTVNRGMTVLIIPRLWGIMWHLTEIMYWIRYCIYRISWYLDSDRVQQYIVPRSECVRSHVLGVTC